MKIGSWGTKIQTSEPDLKDWTKWVRSWDARKISGAETGEPGLNWANWARPPFGYLSLQSIGEEKRDNEFKMD